MDKWSTYKCIIFEVLHDGQHCILAEGGWYVVGDEFRNRVEEAFQSRVRDVALPPAGLHEWERAYCERVSRDHGLILFDRERFAIPGESVPYELCDLMSPERVLLHTKPAEKGSSSLSHLFRQGALAGELFALEPSFRERAREYLARVAPDHVDLIPGGLIRPQNFTVMFGVIGAARRGGNFDIPFFSKVSFHHAARRLEGYGYRVDFCFIPRVEDVELGREMRQPEAA